MSLFNEKHPLVIICRKLAFLSVFKWPLLIFIVYGSLNYSGFCFKEMRYLSDEEKIHKAIAANHTIKGNANYWYSWGYIPSMPGKNDTYRQIIPYEDVDAFLRENPNCCYVIRKGLKLPYIGFADDPAPSFWERVFGHCNFGVRLQYTEKYIEKHLKVPIEPNAKGQKEKRDKLLEEVVGQEGKRFIKDGIFIAGNCGKFCRED